MFLKGQYQYLKTGIFAGKIVAVMNGWLVVFPVSVAILRNVAVDATEMGNSMVTCAACLSVQMETDCWKCDVNCHVMSGPSGM